MRSLFIYIFALVIFASCDEPYQIDEEVTDGRIVIEALLTNRDSMQFVKVTRTSSFYSSDDSPRVTDAIVTVTDGGGVVVNYIHNPSNHDDSVGYYFPGSDFSGVIGQTYHLRVEVDGIVYEATDQLLAVTPVDSLTIDIDEEEREDPEDNGRFYEVLIFAKEPADEVNYYIFKFYRNNELSLANDTDIYYSDDKLLTENINGIAMPVYFGASDTARVEAYSLSRAGYVFFNDLSSLLNNDSGGMFGPIPATPRTNLTNGALGFFQVSAVNSAEIVVE